MAGRVKDVASARHTSPNWRLGPKSVDRTQDAKAAKDKDKSLQGKGNDKQPKGGKRRKPGGQPGHPPQMREQLPPERLNKTIPLVASQCERCQVAELPEIKAKIQNIKKHARISPCCGEVTFPRIPEETRAHNIGPGLAALMGFLVGGCGLSQRRMEEVLESVFEVPVSLGTIAKLEQEMSAALQGAHDEALMAVREADVKHADETGWKKGGRKHWLWVVAMNQVVVFLIHRLRNAAVVMQLLGSTLRGVLLAMAVTPTSGCP